MTKKERMKIVGALYKQKKPMTEIAEMLDISISTVSKYIYVMGLKERKAETTARKIIRLYYEGYTIMQIAYELEITKCYVMAVLRENGISKQYSKTENNLINENTVFVKEKKIELEKEIIDGKSYVVINPLIFLNA